MSDNLKRPGSPIVEDEEADDECEDDYMSCSQVPTKKVSSDPFSTSPASGKSGSAVRRGKKKVATRSKRRKKKHHVHGELDSF